MFTSTDLNLIVLIEYCILFFNDNKFVNLVQRNCIGYIEYWTICFFDKLVNQNHCSKIFDSENGP